MTINWSATWNTYKYIIVSCVSIFVLLQLLNANSNEAPSTHVSSLSTAQVAKDEVVDSKKESEPKQSKPPKKNIYSLTTIEERLSYYFPYKPGEAVEENIYQIWKTSKLEDSEFPDECKELIQRWKDANNEYEHNLLSIQEAEDLLVDELRPTVSEVVEALRLLPHDRLKYEFLKYLTIYLNGGVYADIDTIDIKPVKHWFNSPVLQSNFYAGVDSDYNHIDWDKYYNRRMSFSTSIFRAKSHHPLLARLISRITFIIFTQQELIKSIDWDKEFKNIDSNGTPMIQFTGSLVFTDTIFEYLNSIEDAIYITSTKNEGKDSAIINKSIVGPEVDTTQRFSYKTFSGISSPAQFDDVLILPKVSFNGFDNSFKDVYDDNDEREGYEKFYYGRSKDLTDWSPKKIRLDSS